MIGQEGTFWSNLNAFLKEFPLQSAMLFIATIAIMVQIKGTRSMIRALELAPPPKKRRKNPAGRPPPYISYKYFIKGRVHHLVLQGMKPSEAMKKAASEWREQKKIAGIKNPGAAYHVARVKDIKYLKSVGKLSKWQKGWNLPTTSVH